MSSVDEKQEVMIAGEVPRTAEQPSEEMRRCLDEVATVLGKYDIGVTLCLANDRESVLLYRLPDWCAVVLNDGEPEVNPERLWQTDDLEQLMFRTYRLTSALHQVHERMHDESAQLETFVKDLGRHLLDPNRKCH
ncbi:MAG: hypothetical protein IPL59_15580 [Candidatus Competibacteraceae bacterium]|uniref:Uncharacterized protein n=1 Tax=Candidatus Contendobacter odensis Run_B_J11 TaxID=1400861 RepID=A0A7U7J3L6_9GAMM|nr:hypothetical protein [Candidatus Contendobacter odensis]MBK8536415.1 hypothetical protein [Candidatus Competibacteraceae bacterium]MBK8753217.1 hypothetical protein [Candidatus Competibacteraceae bacterium]CDH44484.1 hypothetical protein BN874_170007 [Candidatus Contendobacter odensis Run_B_J11]